MITVHSAAKFNRNLIPNDLTQQEIRTFINRSRACEFLRI